MKNIVTIGGGTGSYTVLRGLKNLPDVSLTALVSMADDGGSTGILRHKWKVMPPGDVRQCLAALSGKEFLNHKFARGFLKGHKLGNILLALLQKITGDFTKGLKILSWMVGSKGIVMPITRDDSTLVVELDDNTIIKRESIIDDSNLQTPDYEDRVRKVFYEASATLNPSAEKAILSADYIIIGPGNIYCSIIPNFITEGFVEALKKSSAKIIFVMNLVNKERHTMGWYTLKYIHVLEKYLEKKLDFILINKEKLSQEQRARYLKNGDEKIFIVDDCIDARIIRENFLSSQIVVQDKDDSVKRSLIRHDSERLAKVIEKIIST